MKTAMATMFLLLTVATVGTASNFSNGYVNDDGYTWRDGFWWWDGKSYTREWESYTYYRQYGYHSYPYTGYRWRYYEVTPPVAKLAVPKLPLPSDTQWRSKLLEIKKTMTDIDGAMRMEALNNQLYIDSVHALGLGGELAMQRYGSTMQYPYTAVTSTTNYQVGRFGVNGQTIYGHSRSTMAELYGQVDSSLLYQQAAMLTKNAQDWGGKAHDNHTAIVLTDADGRARVAEIYAKTKAAEGALGAAGSAAAQALHAAEGNSAKILKQETTTTIQPSNGQAAAQGSVQYGQTAVQQGTVVPRPANPQSNGGQTNSKEALAVVIQNRCVSCHGPEKAEAKLDLTRYFELDDATKDRIWERLTTTDPERRMPRNPDNTPGDRLPNEEIQLFLKH